MSGSSSTTTQGTTSGTSDPWAPQAAALTSAFSNAGNAYNQSSQAVAPTNFTAQMTPQQLAAYQQMVGAGSNLSVPNTQAATGTALQDAGTSGVTGSLSGLAGYNPSATNNANSVSNAANQYVAAQDIPDQVKNDMLQATQQANQVTMPGIEQNAAMGGNTNSSRTGIADGLVQQGLAEQSAALQGSLTGQAQTAAQQLAQTQANNNNTNTLASLTNEGNIGNTATNTGVNAGNSSVANQGALSSEAAAGGAGLTAAQQAELTNQLQQYQSGVSSPYAALSGLMGIIGSNNWGSQTTGTNNSTTTSNPSAWSTIAGLLSAGGNVAKAFMA